MVNSTDTNSNDKTTSIDVDHQRDEESSKTKHLFSSEIFERDELWNEINIVQQIDASNSHKTSSGVWKYFGKLHYNNQIIDEGHFYCISCYNNRVTKKYQTNTSTGNLIKHIVKAHDIKLEQSIYRIKQNDNSFTVVKEEYQSDPELNLNNSKDSDGDYVVFDINEILIAEVLKRPQLYDSKLCHKNKHQIRQYLWVEVYETLNHLIPLERLPKIWKNIRDRYQKVRRICEKDENKIPKYRYYDKLRFLDSVIDSSVNKGSPYSSVNKGSQPMLVKMEEDELKDECVYLVDRKNENELFEVLELDDDDRENIEVATDNNESSDVEPVTDDGIHKCETARKRRRSSSELDQCNNDDISNYEFQDDVDVQENEVFSIANSVSDELPPQPKRNKDDDVVEDVVVSEDNQLVSMIPINTTTTTLCEFDIFGNYVAAVMKNMKKVDARQLQMKIVQLINSYDEEEST